MKIKIDNMAVFFVVAAPPSYWGLWATPELTRGL